MALKDLQVKDGAIVRNNLRIRMHFNRFVGTTVFHCHILAHEDNGMMGIIDISRSGRLSKATIKSLEEMNKAMPREHSTAGDGAHGGHTAKCHCADTWT